MTTANDVREYANQVLAARERRAEQAAPWGLDHEPPRRPWRHAGRAHWRPFVKGLKDAELHALLNALGKPPLDDLSAAEDEEEVRRRLVRWRSARAAEAAWTVGTAGGALPRPSAPNSGPWVTPRPK
jgi:hypothetical protein